MDGDDVAMTITIGNETWQYFSSTGKAGDFLGEGERGPAGLGNGVAQGKLCVVGSLSFPFWFGPKPFSRLVAPSAAGGYNLLPIVPFGLVGRVSSGRA